MIQLNYKQYGSTGPALIILHGFLGSLDNWHTLSTEWGKAGFRVFAIDQRNHGKSPHTATHTVADMVEDLYDFMFDLHIDHATLLGHSMGGKVAMAFALTYPEKTEKLIVADMAPRAYKHGHDDVFNAIKNVNLSDIQTRKEAEEAMKPYLGDAGTRQFVLKNLERTAEGGYEWKFNFDTLYRDYEDILKPIPDGQNYTGETLFIRGGLSLYIKDKDMDQIHRLFPKAVLHTIAQAGHWLHAEKPVEFSATVTQFLLQ